MAKKPSRTMIRQPYKSYMFKDKDPVIDKLRTLRADNSKMTEKAIEEESGVKRGTSRNWFKGGTRRPQFASVEAYARALGKTFVLQGYRAK